MAFPAIIFIFILVITYHQGATYVAGQFKWKHNKQPHTQLLKLFQRQLDICLQFIQNLDERELYENTFTHMNLAMQELQV